MGGIEGAVAGEMEEIHATGFEEGLGHEGRGERRTRVLHTGMDLGKVRQKKFLLVDFRQLRGGQGAGEAAHSNL